MENKMRTVMAAILDVQEGDIHEESSPRNTANWDSLRHINLIVALEEEFNVSFSDAEIVKMIDYRTMKETLEAKMHGK